MRHNQSIKETYLTSLSNIEKIKMRRLLWAAHILQHKSLSVDYRARDEGIAKLFLKISKRELTAAEKDENRYSSTEYLHNDDDINLLANSVFNKFLNDNRGNILKRAAKILRDKIGEDISLDDVSK